MRGTKRRIFTLVTISIPFLAIILLEVGLRLMHYGPDLSLLSRVEINGRPYYTMNPGVKLRYFSHVAFSPSTSPDFFSLPKPSRTYRIFCLGGSTTVGYPYWFNGSFSSYLRDRLRAIFPEKQIEIINMGMTATNSFTTADFARELVDCQADLFLVYDGHNEFYGALGAASNESLGATRWITLLYLRLVRLKSFILVRDGYEALSRLFSKPASVEPGATMMEKLAVGHYVPYGSSPYRAALGSFRGNLSDIRSSCESRGIPLLVASQVSNLRGMKPFVSGELPGRTPGERAAFENRFHEGQMLLDAGAADSALHVFRSLLAADSLRADTHFQIARCMKHLGLRAGAEVEYVRARDLDQLRFRTSSDFNNVIRDIADDHGTYFVDMESAFRAASPDSLIGNELIMEHLHPNSGGYFLMAKVFARSMREHGLLADSLEWAHRDTIDDHTLWDDRSVTQIDELMARRSRDVLVSGWPFAQQRPVVPAIPLSDTLGQIAERMTRGTMMWTEAHEAAAQYYVGRGELDLASREYAALVRTVPLNVDYYFRLAGVYATEGRTGMSRSVLNASLNIEKTMPAYRGLGDIALQSGKPLEAITNYKMAISLIQSVQERAEMQYVLALAYLRANMPELCVTELRQVLAERPDFKQAQDLLATIQRIQRSRGQGHPPGEIHQ